MSWVPWWTAGVIANVCIMYVEQANRRATGDWIHTLPYTIVPIVIAQWGLYHAWKGAPTMMVAWVVSTLGNSALRLGNSYYIIGEKFGWQVPVGAVIMLLGGLIVKAGQR